MSSISLPTRKIGNDTVTAIGFGAMGIGGVAYGANAGSDEERFAVLDRLFALGCTNWDTASVYGDSEELIGKWFKRTGNRDKIFLATKFGATPAHTIRGDPEFIKQEIATSLRKLQTDYVDLYYQHRTDKNTPIEVTVGAMAELVKEGKVKYLGLSEASPSTIRRAHKVHSIAAIQVEYSLWELTLEKPGDILETARDLGISIFAYSPTGRGLATGRFKSIDDLPQDDFRRLVPKYSAENFVHINKLVEGLQGIGKKYDATPAQVAIAWLLAQGKDIIPIPGSKQIKYCEENLGAAEVFTKLTEEDLKALRKLSDEAEETMGKDDRYVGFLMDMCYVETPPLEGWTGSVA